MKMDLDVNAPWNEGTRPPLADWLASSQSAEDRERLAVCGNIVVPLQAKVAMANLKEIQHAVLTDNFWFKRLCFSRPRRAKPKRDTLASKFFWGCFLKINDYFSELFFWALIPEVCNRHASCFQFKESQELRFCVVFLQSSNLRTNWACRTAGLALDYQCGGLCWFGFEDLVLLFLAAFSALALSWGWTQILRGIFDYNPWGQNLIFQVVCKHHASHNLRLRDLQLFVMGFGLAARCGPAEGCPLRRVNYRSIKCSLARFCFEVWFVVLQYWLNCKSNYQPASAKASVKIAFTWQCNRDAASCKSCFQENVFSSLQFGWCGWSFACASADAQRVESNPLMLRSSFVNLSRLIQGRFRLSRWRAKNLSF